MTKAEEVQELLELRQRRIWESCRYCKYHPLQKRQECLVAGDWTENFMHCSEWEPLFCEGTTLTGKGIYKEVPKEDRLRELLLRKAMGLPFRNSLVYYEPFGNEPIPVHDVTIEEIYSQTEAWFTLLIRLEGGEERRVHSEYFADMQKGRSE